MINKVVEITDRDGYGLDYEINKFIETNLATNEYIKDIKICERERRIDEPWYKKNCVHKVGGERVEYLAYLFIEVKIWYMI